MEIIRNVDVLREHVRYSIVSSFGNAITSGTPCACGYDACKTNDVARICVRCLDYFSESMSNKIWFDNDFINKHPWIRRCCVAICKQYIGVIIAAYRDDSKYNDLLDAKGKCWCCTTVLTWRSYRDWDICEDCRNDAKNFSVSLVQKMFLARSIYIHGDICMGCLAVLHHCGHVFKE